MSGNDLTEARARWSKVADGTFDSDDIAALLRALWKKWQPGTLAAELGRALAEQEESGDDELSPIEVESWETITKTGRIDGILPLTIPSPSNLARTVAELREEVARLGVGSAAEGIGEEIGLSLLALLHDRPLVTDHRLAVRLYIDSPGDSLMLMGRLPLGGRISVFTSAISPVDCGPLPGGALRHIDRFETRRDKEGRLLLEPLPPRTRTTRETWTFRL